MWDWAPRYGALLVFAEHRFYGKTMPFGKESYTSAASLGYLSSEQVKCTFEVRIFILRIAVGRCACTVSLFMD